MSVYVIELNSQFNLQKIEIQFYQNLFLMQIHYHLQDQGTVQRGPISHMSLYLKLYIILKYVK